MTLQVQLKEKWKSISNEIEETEVGLQLNFNFYENNPLDPNPRDKSPHQCPRITPPTLIQYNTVKRDKNE